MVRVFITEKQSIRIIDADDEIFQFKRAKQNRSVVFSHYSQLKNAKWSVCSQSIEIPCPWAYDEDGIFNKKVFLTNPEKLDLTKMIHMGHCKHLRVRPVGRQISKRTAARIARTTINCSIAENEQGDMPIVIEAGALVVRTENNSRHNLTLTS